MENCCVAACSCTVCNLWRHCQNNDKVLPAYWYKIFCDMWITEPITVCNIPYYNTTTFCVSGRLCQYNCLFWGTENPRFLRKIIGNIFTKSGHLVHVTYCSVTGPYFFNEAAMYLDMLQIYNLDELPLSTIRNSYFQRDTMPAHHTHGTQNYMDIVFWYCWIGHSTAPSWPSMSPDLSPCIICCWEWRKIRCIQLNLELSMA
jgi:hypothetical protein